MIAARCWPGMFLSRCSYGIPGQRPRSRQPHVEFGKSAGGTCAAKKALHSREVSPPQGCPRIARSIFVRFATRVLGLLRRLSRVENSHDGVRRQVHDSKFVSRSSRQFTSSSEGGIMSFGKVAPFQIAVWQNFKDVVSPFHSPPVHEILLITNSKHKRPLHQLPEAVSWPPSRGCIETTMYCRSFRSRSGSNRYILSL